MCGIVGSINSKFDIKSALNKIKHRGPDAEGIFENEYIQFGHVRLSILDLSTGGNQPFVNQSTGSALIFNGEIYNYKALKRELESDYTFQTTSDTEVLFCGLQRYGISYLSKLQGMFAFAYFDGLNKVAAIQNENDLFQLVD